MKTNIIILVLFAVFASETLGLDRQMMFQDFQKSAEMCRESVKATAGDLEMLMQHKEPTSMEGKCMHACLMKHYKVMNDNGKLEKSMALEHAKKMVNDDAEKMKIAEEIVNTCEKIDASTDECEAAVAYGKCLIEQAAKYKIEDYISE